MDITSLIINLVAGAVGGNAGGAIAKNSSLGTVGNSIAGALGGLGGGSILSMLTQPAVADAAAAAAGGGFNIAGLLGSGVGGIVLQIVAGLIKNSMNKTA